MLELAPECCVYLEMIQKTLCEKCKRFGKIIQSRLRSAKDTFSYNSVESLKSIRLRQFLGVLLQQWPIKCFHFKSQSHILHTLFVQTHMTAIYHHKLSKTLDVWINAVQAGIFVGNRRMSKRWCLIQMVIDIITFLGWFCTESSHECSIRFSR